MSSLAELQKAAYAGLNRSAPQTSAEPATSVPLAEQQAEAYTQPKTINTEGADAVVSPPVTSRPKNKDYNSNPVTSGDVGQANQSLKNIGQDKPEVAVTAAVLASTEITFDSGEDNPVLWKKALSDELVKACGKSLKTPEACFEGLKTAMSDPNNGLGQTKESSDKAELFTYARETSEIEEMQRYLGLTADGIVGPETRQALAAHRAVYGESALTQAFPRKDESSTVTALYNEFTRQGGPEGDKPHQAGDNMLTLAGGVVADGLTYDGIPVVQGTWIDRKDFDPAKVDTSNAAKTVGGVTIKRSAFKTDAEFINASLEAFTVTARQSVEDAGVAWATLPDNIKNTIVSLGWNLGEGTFKNSDIKAMYAELAKPNPKQAPLHQAFLTKATVKGGGAGVGLAKRRANDWNKVSEVLAGQTIETIEASYDTKKGSTATTIITYRNKKGAIIFSYDTGRSHGDYENSSLEMNLNSKGEFVLNKNKPFVNPIPPVTSIIPKARPDLKAFGGQT